MCVRYVREVQAIPLSLLFFFNDTPTTEIYTLSLHDALPISVTVRASQGDAPTPPGSRLAQGYSPYLPRGTSHSHHEGLPAVSHNVSHFQSYPIPPSETAEIDVSPITDPPTAIVIAEATAGRNTMNIVYLEISVTAPAATN